ncbi:uncharacterized protein A4U43_C04F4590 [Asparagus officinalis]|uniref:Remorin C-terminal domain-containing protein n=1 Tax=Asparagus officinalis TaxID=4686 RepID=A0A5P1F0Z7_ASPOF|nr:uncharacterized protein LOC109836614 [Asparagus officinalis]ONK71087.1 uncharacterized protein A4U43_C04F4590 [Asparagus officinalis]
MEYERIHKPSNPHQQGGGFSPSKLRAILLGIEKKRKEEEEEEKEEEKEETESGISLRSDDRETEDRGANAPENCKDVDIVSLPLERSTSVEFANGYKSGDYNLASSRVRAQEDDSFDLDNLSSFEFHKTAERVPHRSSLMAPFSKPAPSKWDDAQKWISSPNRMSKGGGGGLQPKRSSLGGYGSRSLGSKVVLEVTDEVDTKKMDTGQAKKDISEQKAVRLAPDLFPSAPFENPFADAAINLSVHDTSTSLQSGATSIAPPLAVTSVPMRDMGTEMTPIASQEASQTGTPIRSTTPTRSPNSSRPLSPVKTGPTSVTNESAENLGNSDKQELSEKELKMKTRREIMALGQQLGKTSIAAWASKEEEESNEAVATVPVDQPSKSVNEARATAWEDTEKAKYLARFKQEEIKIQAWENHQKAKTEAEMRRIEVEVEKMRAIAQEKLMNQLAAARHKAEQKRVAAEAKRRKQAARTAKQAEYIRKTGQIPTSFSCWDWCS